MITKEWNINKKCCLYTSDFHLEMILLPYIKENIDRTNFIILTQNDLTDTVKILLDRVNINNEYKKKILDLNWQGKNSININEITNFDNEKNIDLIIKGDFDYVKKINQNLENNVCRKINVIDCYCIEDKKFDFNDIKNEYKDYLNTTKMT